MIQRIKRRHNVSTLLQREAVLAGLARRHRRFSPHGKDGSLPYYAVGHRHTMLWVVAILCCGSSPYYAMGRRHTMLWVVRHTMLWVVAILCYGSSPYYAMGRRHTMLLDGIPNASEKRTLTTKL